MFKKQELSEKIEPSEVKIEKKANNIYLVTYKNNSFYVQTTSPNLAYFN